MSSKKIWSFVLVVYLTLLTFVMWFGYPFESFDHQNYISFLEEPFPFFFEPLYTLVAISLTNVILPEYRFFVVFFLFVATPTALIMLLDARHGCASPQYIFFWILFKSSIIGFISQRFWFAELWMTYFILRFHSNLMRACVGVIFTSGIHFGVAGVLPVYYFLLRGASRIFLILLAILVIGIVYFKQVDYTFLGYDYSRYVGMGEERGFPYFSLLTMTLICVMAVSSLQTKMAIRVMLASLGVLVFKAIFSDLEVYSRIFQAQVDLLLIFCAMYGRKRAGALLLPVFCICFVLAQALFSPTSDEVVFYIKTAFINSFVNFKSLVL